MTVTFRQYSGSIDFTRIGSFLIKHYQPDNRDGN